MAEAAQTPKAKDATPAMKATKTAKPTATAKASATEESSATEEILPRRSPPRPILMDSSQVIIRPVVSEKSYVLSAANRYTFRVHPDAHKTQIRQAVQELFEVQVVKVRTLSVKSKPKRRGDRQRAHAHLEEGDRATG